MDFSMAFFYGRNFGNNIGRSLSWSNDLKTATDVANAVVYLHTAFPTPIIHRDLGTKNIVIDNNGVAKLVDFSLSIALPPGESQVEVDIVVGMKGHLDPDYMTTGISTEKGEIGEIEHQLQAFLRLALRCTLDRGAHRPYIIDVANELERTSKDSKVCSSTLAHSK
ncbi:non-functional pseudokinase ZED1-like [Olea europaea subsp. europaea]|uniref:Non-functional pseudokinase ZED1-like n=1 Tax=Olea europaea subsp. europaea TaxID=158383 RepID=A0A8S0SL76_OLEEU|nr:non-functional pseudokinase ZED1-like [Olea europaea subsp. europaea]